MDGKFRVIGNYENEEEAAVDYAREQYSSTRSKSSRKSAINILSINVENSVLS